ncbi:MAG: SsrA-binding protein SmpB [Synergistaceae bacterium]|jgi:SsrA-binding protein|nr:SsrA-binding protein SmpB [Synergistaceae bacterium]
MSLKTDNEHENKTIARNRKARHEYFILEAMEAGIVLSGTEIKSVRAGSVNLRDGYARIDRGELWLYNVHISPYEMGTIYNKDPIRPRKLLVRKKEILKLQSKIREKGLTLIPLSMYLKEGKRAKIELAIAKGRQAHDKRDAIAERDVEREISRNLRERSKRDY